MKKYRLKQWYPRIPVYLEDGYIISFDDENKGIAIYEFVNGTLDTFEMSGAELECTQYWEFIEEVKPLFITEDGVSIYTNNIELFAVNDMFETASSTRFDFGVSRKGSYFTTNPTQMNTFGGISVCSVIKIFKITGFIQ